MSEQKNPLPVVITGTIGVIILTLVGFMLLGVVVKQINPKNTAKLMHSFKCKKAYKKLSAKGGDASGASWAKRHMSMAVAAHAACMDGKMPVPKKSKAPAKEAKKAPAKKAPAKDDTKVVKAAKNDAAPAKKALAKASKKDPAKKAPAKDDTQKDAPAKKNDAAAKKAPAKASKKDPAGAKGAAAKGASKASKRAPARRAAKKKPLTQKQLAKKCAGYKKKVFTEACMSEFKYEK